MIQGVHHLALIVSDEKCVTFYKELGFDIFKQIERQYDTVILLLGYGILLELFVDPNHPPRSNPEPLGLRHLAFKVDDIENTVRMLTEATGSLKTDWVGEKYCFIVDPDGNSIELHE